MLETVSTAENAEPTDLEPLYDAIDPDALNSLFDGKNGTTGSVVFRYHGYDVTVERDGRVTLESPNDS